MALIPTFCDVETAYSAEYSLTKMTTAEYILHPSFEFICCAIKEHPREPSRTYWGDEAEAYLKSLDWSQRMLVAHHCRFDGAVLAWRLGIRPKMYGCTMALADVVTAPYAGSASLAATSLALGLPPKGTEILNARGKWRRDFTPDEAMRYMAYCARDNDNCADIFATLARAIPKEEWGVIDDVIRMFIEPRLQYDMDTLHQYLGEIEVEKATLLAEAGMTDRADLMSAEQFATALRALDVEPPQKYSPTQQKLIYAFAKSDEAFTDLLEDDDERVARLVAARLGHKSTIEETRTKRFIATGFLTPEHWAPVPLRYCAAMTHRLGGTDRINKQNLRRTHPKDPKRPSPLRKSMKAMPGHVVMSVDASQIELRLLMWQAGQHDALNVLQSGQSMYLDFGRDLFGREITKAEVENYTLAKISVLSSGYGVGASKFKNTARTQSAGLIVIDELEAMRVVSAYRRKYSRVPALWKTHEHWLSLMANLLRYQQVEIGGKVVWEIMPGALRGPTGLCMLYPDLRKDSTGENWIYNYRRTQVRRIYGPKITENTCQHLARCIVSSAQNRIRERTGERPVLQAHDELVYVVPESRIGWLGPILKEEMSRRTVWAPTLPLGAEVKYGHNYGEMQVLG